MNKKEILISSLQIFMKFGIKSVTMDDVARQLGISKKTLYLHVSDKKDLVKKSVQIAIDEEQCMLGEIIVDEQHAIDELLEINAKVSEKLQSIQPAVMFDLQKYYPETWNAMENHKQCFIYEMIILNLKKGVKQGVYRDNVNEKIIAKIYVSMIDKMFDSETFSIQEYSFKVLHREIARYHIRGIANEKGIAYLVKRLKDNKYDF